MVLATEPTTAQDQGWVPAPLPLSGNARFLLNQRYLMTDEDGNVTETPEERFWTVAQAVARAEPDPDHWARRYYDELFLPLVFMPNTPTIANGGRDGCLSGCFVVPITDSMQGINHAREQLTQILKSGGGIGYSLGQLRPEGSRIRSTHKGACGPVKVGRDYDFASTTYTQGNGALREGAQMMMLPISHPDVRKFIHAKDDGVSITHANLSVLVTQDFMDALDGNSPYVGAATEAYVAGHKDWQKFGQGAFNFAWPLTFGGKVAEWTNARVLWDEIATSAHKTGDPGLWFIERANGPENNPLHELFSVESTNPCGEQALEPYGSCNLGSIDVSKFWRNGRLDKAAFRETTRLAVRFLDGVVTVNPMPTPETETANKGTRRIGLGLMGVADLLVKARLPYDPNYPATRALLVDLLDVFRSEVDETSLELGREKGPYGFWDWSTHKRDHLPYRNAWRTTMAPTGSIAVIADCSHGLEPIFGADYTRRLETGEKIPVKHWAYQEHLDAGGDPDVLPPWLRFAHDIGIEDQVGIQALFQGAIDNSVSKTINMVETATVDDVKWAYRLAWESGCKGITIYRDHSRDHQVIDTGTSRSDVLVTVAASPHRQKLPRTRASLTHKFDVGEQEGYFTVGFYPDGRPGELFISASKQGSTVNGLLGSLGQTVSVALQYGVPPEALFGKMRHQMFEPAGRTGDSAIPTATSIIDYLGAWMINQIAEHGGQVSADVTAPVMAGNTCPSCGGRLIHSEGCVSCPPCAYYKCG